VRTAFTINEGYHPRVAICLAIFSVVILIPVLFGSGILLEKSIHTYTLLLPVGPDSPNGDRDHDQVMVLLSQIGHDNPPNEITSRYVLKIEPVEDYELLSPFDKQLILQFLGQHHELLDSALASNGESSSSRVFRETVRVGLHWFGGIILIAYVSCILYIVCRLTLWSRGALGRGRIEAGLCPVCRFRLYDQFCDLIDVRNTSSCCTCPECGVDVQADELIGLRLMKCPKFVCQRRHD